MAAIFKHKQLCKQSPTKASTSTKKQIMKICKTPTTTIGTECVDTSSNLQQQQQLRVSVAKALQRERLLRSVHKLAAERQLPPSLVLKALRTTCQAQQRHKVSSMIPQSHPQDTVRRSTTAIQEQ